MLNELRKHEVNSPTFPEFARHFHQTFPECQIPAIHQTSKMSADNTVPAPAAAVPAPAPDVPPLVDDDTTMFDNHAKVLDEFVGPNSPTSKIAPSPVWQDVKRLRKQHPLDTKGDMTHICRVRIADSEEGERRYCNKLMKLHKNKPRNPTTQASWLTTKAGDHLKACHPVDSDAGANGAARAKKKNDETTEIALEYGMPDAQGKDIDTLSKFKLSKRDRSLSAQVRSRWGAGQAGGGEWRGRVLSGE